MSKPLRITADEFTEQFLFALSNGQMAMFRFRMRSVSSLTFVNVAALRGRVATKVELKHTVDSLRRRGAVVKFVASGQKSLF